MLCTLFHAFALILYFFAVGPISVEAQDKGAELYKTCVQCHGADGLGNAEQAAPRIAGQYDWYILSQLNAFKNKVRINEKMDPFIQNLTENDFVQLAKYVSQMPLAKGK